MMRQLVDRMSNDPEQSLRADEMPADNAQGLWRDAALHTPSRCRGYPRCRDSAGPCARCHTSGAKASATGPSAAR